MSDFPVNVRVIYEDGTEIPIECKYTGTHDEIAQWLVVSEYEVDRVTKIKADLFPAKSTILLPWKN